MACSRSDQALGRVHSLPRPVGEAEKIVGQFRRCGWVRGWVLAGTLENRIRNAQGVVNAMLFLWFSRFRCGWQIPCAYLCTCTRTHMRQGKSAEPQNHSSFSLLIRELIVLNVVPVGSDWNRIAWQAAPSIF